MGVCHECPVQIDGLPINVHAGHLSEMESKSGRVIINESSRNCYRGTGPFLLIVALQLHEAGVKVAAVVETARRRELWRQLRSLCADPKMLADGAAYIRRIRRAGIPILWGHVVTGAEGGHEVNVAVVAPCDDDGVADSKRSRTIPVDTLCVGYGFVPGPVNNLVSWYLSTDLEAFVLRT